MKKFLLILIGITICILSVSYNEYKDIKNSVVRLHIIANSDSFEDQSIKIRVRDYILKKYSFNNKNIESNKQSIFENLESISADITKFLQDNGFNYGASASFGEFYFPTKSYSDLSLPCGDYTALRIELGKGKGKNWWCVMYPPLCFTTNAVGEMDQQSKETLKNLLTEQEYSTITKINCEFKIIEIINNTVNKLRN